MTTITPARLRRKTADPTTGAILNQLSAVDHSPEAMHRRRFLQGALALGGATALLPSWLAEAAEAGPPLGVDDRILIVLMMGGGNDGFKMISPLDNSTFTSTRDFLADDPATAHSIGDGLYLNQYLPSIKTMWDQGDVACVLGVGNELDDHSHFSSMASWMAADLTPPYNSGWLGRYAEGAGYDSLGALVVGDGGVPLHMRTQNFMSTAISSYGNLFGASEYDADTRRYRGMHKYAEGSSGLGPFVDLAGDTFSTAMSVAKEVNPAYAQVDGEEGIVRQLAITAGLINLDVGARVIGVSYGDFDHHDDQAGPYQFRMTELDAAITRFYETLDPAFADRVAIMTFSEFGRSFAPNGSRGTDHGTASNLMVIGKNINGGVYGEMPNFAAAALDDWGDVEHTVDFRSYYATALNGWLGADAGEVLGANYEDLGIFPSGGGGGGVGGATASFAQSCLNNDGRFDVTVVNGGTQALFEITVGSLAPRYRDLGPGQSVTVPVTGRRDGSYNILVKRDGVVVINETGTVSCDPAITVSDSCLAQNGRFDVYLNNTESTTGNYVVKLSGLADRSKTLAPGAAGRISITGRRDGDYDLRVLRNGQVVYDEDHVVACDPATEAVRVDVSCLQGNGRVDVHLYNNGSSTASYEVSIGSLPPRTRTLAAGASVRVSATGRQDGQLPIAVRRGGTVIHTSTVTIACDG